MVSLFFALDYHIINVGVHSALHQTLEHLDDHSLVGKLSILQFKRHDLVRKNAPRGDKCNFLPIRLVHYYLVLGSACI